MGKGGALIATNPTFKGGMEAPDTCVLDLKWERVGYNELKVGRDRVGCFLIEIVAVAVVWWWRQWHTGEDTEYPELPPSRKRFIQIMMMPMIQLLFHLCPLPFPSLHLPLIPHPPLLLRPSKPLLLVVIPLFLLLFPNLNMINITDQR